MDFFPVCTNNDLRAAEKIIYEKTIETRNFGDIPIGDDFWTCGPQENRSWCWTLQAYLPLDPLIATGKTNVLKKLVDSWWDRFKLTPIEDDFPWHDHATAMRLDRLSRMALQLPDCKYTELAARHAELLIQEHFYSKNTNHGFDQSVSLVLASLGFPEHKQAIQWCEVGIARLRGEIEFAFTSEGVHVENSPAYHMGMISNMVRARAVLKAVGADTEGFEGVFDKALCYLAWITRPDRAVAYLGDSVTYRPSVPSGLADLPSASLVQWVATGGAEGVSPQTRSIIYAQSGYAIYRSSWENWPGHTHIVMKCGFLSAYHRHDDDLNVLVHAYGEDWFIDSGLYNHNHADPVRVYMRSSLAHNVPYFPNVNVLRTPFKNTNEVFASISSFPADGYDFGVDCMTRMYEGGIIRRSLLVRDESNFRIADRFSGFGDKPRYWLFHVPCNKKITTGKGRAMVRGFSKKLFIRASVDILECATYRGKDAIFPSVLSKQLNRLEDSQVIVFGPCKEDKVVFHFSFDTA